MATWKVLREEVSWFHLWKPQNFKHELASYNFVLYHTDFFACKLLYKGNHDDNDMVGNKISFVCIDIGS